MASKKETREERPTVFPVEIPRRLIKLFSWHGETVLDPFAGSGTIAEAVVPLGRNVLCVDQFPIECLVRMLKL